MTQAGVCRINILHVIFNSAIAESYIHVSISNKEPFFEYTCDEVIHVISVGARSNQTRETERQTDRKSERTDGQC